MDGAESITSIKFLLTSTGEIFTCSLSACFSSSSSLSRSRFHWKYTLALVSLCIPGYVTCIPGHHRFICAANPQICCTSFFDCGLSKLRNSSSLDCSGLIKTSALPSLCPIDSTITPPHFNLRPTCNLLGANFMPLVWQTVKIFRITTSSSSRLLPHPNTSSAFLKQDDVFLISVLVERSKTSGLIERP